MQIFRTGTLSL